MTDTEKYKDDILYHLRAYPAFRERSKKDLGIAKLIAKRFPQFKDLTSELSEACRMNNSLDRSWRKALEGHPELRGSDYGQKDALEEDAQTKLGYLK